MKVLLLAALLSCITKCRARELWCKDPEGNKVEWSIIYKLPHRLAVPPSGSLSSAPKRRKNDGSNYGYIDSRMVADNITTFMSGPGGIFDEEENPLANTLEPIFKWDQEKADQELAYIAYNDQPPDGEKLTSEWISGHTKGVVLFDLSSGIWLVHSVPKFPANLFSGEYSFPKSGYPNGQTLLCMTFKTQSLDTIAGHLLDQNPHIFRGHAPETLAIANPNLQRLLSNDTRYNVTTKVTENVIQGIYGMPFLAFAKSGLLEDDVYSVSIAPALTSDLYVSSWQNGEGGKLDSECSLKYKVLDVESVSFTFNDTKASWLTKHDHAKWAVTRNSSEWVCIGSINRMRSQFKRGGETVCLKDDVIGKMFQEAVVDHSTCGNTTAS